MAIQRVRLDKIASVTRRARLSQDVLISPEIISREGFILAGRILNHKSVYNTVETAHGRMSKLKEGDVLAGALGPRFALHGFSGYVPDSLKVGDVINVLNLGGVIGKCTSANKKLVGDPFELEVLGSVLTLPHIDRRVGHPASIQEFSFPLESELQPGPQVIMVSGTSMNSGKTAVASEVVRALHARGLRVGAAKLTGVSLRNDTMNMMDNGASVAYDFTDMGVVTSSPASSVQVSRTIANVLSREKTDVLVFELGDGILGCYGVAAILEDKAWTGRVMMHIVCAQDQVGAWGAAEIFRQRAYGEIALMSGPVTDNEVGITFIKNTLGLPAINAIGQRKDLYAFIESRLS